MRPQSETPRTPVQFAARELDTQIGGQPVVELAARVPKDEYPRIVSALIIPGRGMHTYQLVSHLPYRGEFPMLYSPPLDEGRHFFDFGPGDFMGNRSFMIGGAILLPFANRIRGTLLPDGKSILTTINGHPAVLPANWSSAGNTRGEKVAMHGLMLKSPMHEITLDADDTRATVTGVLHAGDFDGRWVGGANVTVVCTLNGREFELRVTVENTGDEPLPVGIGWNPYFEFPGGDRTRVRLRIPAASMAPVTDYDDVFPTGETVAVRGTPFNFGGKHGGELGERYFDDTFTSFRRDDAGETIIEIIDPLEPYGVRLRACSECQAAQVYAPPDKNFALVGPQFNLTDPFNESTWGTNANMGMVILKPGQTTEYRVGLELFTPDSP